MRNYDYYDYDDPEDYAYELERARDRRRTMMQQRGDAVVVRDPAQVTGESLVLWLFGFAAMLALLALAVLIGIFLVPLIALAGVSVVAFRLERAWMKRSAATRLIEGSRGRTTRAA